MPETIFSTTNAYNFFLKDVTYEQFNDMRKRMFIILSNEKAKLEYPQELADLQFFYDCWTLEEGMYTKFSQPLRCKLNFIKSLEYLEIRLIKYSQDEIIIAEQKKNEYIFPKRKKRYIVYFDFDSSSLNNEGSIVLWDLMNDLNKIKNSNYTVNILGHTDRTGKKIYNKKLSKRRSNTIKHYLIKNGIDKNKITIRWLGEIDPQLLTKDEHKEQFNRRVEIVVDVEE